MYMFVIQKIEKLTLNNALNTKRTNNGLHNTKKNTQKKPNLFQLGHIVHAHFEQNRNFSPKLGKTKIVA